MCRKQFSSPSDYMAEAIRLARVAARKNETPIGCVIVRNGKIIGRGYNLRNRRGSVLQHAEITAIRKACRRVHDWRLEDCTLYVSLEPCPMCAGAIVQARIPKVVFAASNPKAGCAGSVMNLLRESRFNHQCEVESGLMEEESREVLQDFFVKLRGARKK